jgi:predicted phage terminase large subunit-like protein
LPSLPPALQLVVDARLKWAKTARLEQLTPAGDWWDVWAIIAGRGFGKTRSGAEDIAFFALRNPGTVCGVVAPTLKDCRKTCFQGKSGLLSIIPPELRLPFNKVELELALANGSKILGFGSEDPDRLRGPNLHRAWCDELASWQRAQMQATWDMLMLCLRAGERPQIVVTTTPKPLPLVKELIAREGEDVAITTGSTYDNAANLAPSFLRMLKRRYEGTRLGRQELHAEILDANEDAIVRPEWWDLWDQDELPTMDYVLVSLDTAMTERDLTGGRKGAKRGDTADLSRENAGDPSACTVWGVWTDFETDRSRIMLLDAWEDWLGWPALIARIERTANRIYANCPVSTILIENKANGKSVAQELRRRIRALGPSEGVQIIEFDPRRSDKVARLNSVAGLFEQGMIYAPDEPWAQMVIDRLEQFPHGEHDDIPDTVSQGLIHIRRRGFALYGDEQPEPGERRSRRPEDMPAIY